MAKNATKHGLRAETIVAATVNVEAFRDLSEAWYAAYEPRSPGQIAALDRCVYYTWQFHRIVSAEAAVIDEQVNAADVVWMRDQQAQVAAHRATLAIDPEAALCGLNETAAGCRWQISEWTVLKSALDEDGCWYAASHRDRAVRLFGLRPEQTTNEMVYWLSLINLCARDEPDARALAWYLEGANIPDTLRRRMRDGAPGRDECVRELRARVDDELTILKGREEYLRIRVEEPSRKGAPRRALLAAGEEGSRLLRYERMNDTAFHRNYKQLLKGEGERKEEGVEERTCDEEREQAAAYVAEHNRKADEYRVEAASKAIVPEMEAPNKAIVPKVAGASTALVESSAEWDPEVSALASLAKVMKIYDARRETESFATPVDQVSSVEGAQAGGGPGVGHPPDGGGEPPGSFSPAG